jgi:hypothetical protein
MKNIISKKTRTRLKKFFDNEDNNKQIKKGA